MYALTIHQPWAWAIIHGPKRVENRSWSTSHRGPLVIHAGKSRDWLCDFLPDGTPAPPTDRLVFGAILGVVDLVDVIFYWGAKPLPQSALHFAFGPWCWIVENPRPLPVPIPMAGAQGLWRVDYESIKRESELSRLLTA